MLGINSRKILLSFHILLNAILIGCFSAMVFLNLVKNGIYTGDELFALNLAIFKIHDWLVSYTAFGVVFTGFVFSLFTKWGFFDYYWLMVKWLGLLILFVLILGFLAPAVNGITSISDIERTGALTNPDYLQYSTEVNILAFLILFILIIMVVISVFKPWGKRIKLFHVNRKIVIIGNSVLGIALIMSAALQFTQLQKFRAVSIQNISPLKIADGTYSGTADFGFIYSAEVEIKNHVIKHIKINRNRNSFYAHLAEGIVSKVMAAQNPNVDAVTGATTTSKCLQKAIENAMSKGITQHP